MPGRIEGLPGRIDDLDAGLFEGTLQLPQGGLRALQQGGTGIGGAGRDAGLQRIADRNQCLGEALDGELARVVDFTLGALAVVLQLGDRPQVAVPVLLCLGLRSGQGRNLRRRPRVRTVVRGDIAQRLVVFAHVAMPSQNWRLKETARSVRLGGYLRAFKAEPSSFAVTSTMGMTRS